MITNYLERYGRWAVIAGASEGLGAAFAATLARRGCNLLLLARRENLLEELAASLKKDHQIEVRIFAADLADPLLFDQLKEKTADIEVGIAVYNAAYSVIGPVLSRTLDDALKMTAVNIEGPLRFVHALAPAMVARKRGAIVLMSSIAGFQGSPRIAVYSGSKAFNTVFGESLWAELKPHGVEVLVSCAGGIRTPGYLKTGKKDAPGMFDPDEVAERTLAALGRDKGPIVVPGFVNKLARIFLGRLLTRRGAVELMERNTRDLE